MFSSEMGKSFDSERIEHLNSGSDTDARSDVNGSSNGGEPPKPPVVDENSDSDNFDNESLLTSEARRIAFFSFDLEWKQDDLFIKQASTLIKAASVVSVALAWGFRDISCESSLKSVILLLGLLSFVFLMISTFFSLMALCGIPFLDPHMDIFKTMATGEKYLSFLERFKETFKRQADLDRILIDSLGKLQRDKETKTCLRGRRTKISWVMFTLSLVTLTFAICTSMIAEIFE